VNPEVISAYLGEDDETSSHDEASQEKSAHA
jgi:branched-chain amino acid transport system ATP-binding protein